MRIIAISDTHCKHRELKLPKGDVLVHSGDFCKRGSYQEFEDFIKWFDEQDFKHKIFVAGNHDGCLEAMYGQEESFMQALIKTGRIKGEGLYYLRDSSLKINGVHFYGAPWQPNFYDWSFQCARGEEIREKWKLIPEDVDVLITHGPPYGHGDKAPPYFGPNRRNAGCFELLKRVMEVKPKIHIFGHIHCEYGRTESDEVPTLFVNAASCGENYEITNSPQIVDIEPPDEK